MAHQAYGIRWSTLVANLKYQPQRDPYDETPSDIVFRFKRNQGTGIEHFAISFARNLADYTTTEQTRPERLRNPCKAPAPTDVIINDKTAKKINGTVYKWRAAYASKTGYPVKWRRGLCPHTADGSDAAQPDNPNQAGRGESFKCTCPLPVSERRASAFLRQYVLNDCYYFHYDNGDAFLNMELVKTLLLYGEMDPLLRICKHPGVDYAQWQDLRECYDTSCQVGWCTVYERALDAYIGLNVLYSFPKLWDEKSGCCRQSPGDGNPFTLHMEDEYRNTAAYQRLLWQCTRTLASVVSVLPHQKFFGIEDSLPRGYSIQPQDINHGLEWPALMKLAMLTRAPGHHSILASSQFPFGRIPIDAFLNCRERLPYMPSEADVLEVYDILYGMGLPSELVIQILKDGDYDTPRRRLPIAHDPLHPDSREELMVYLTFCWLTLIRCNMFAQALDIEINWEVEVVECLARIFGLVKQLVEIGIAIGLQPCPDDPCYPVSTSLGWSLYAGPYGPNEIWPGSMPYQNFTVLSPRIHLLDGRLGVAHAKLVGAMNNPLLQVISNEITTV
ncbi:hypothetical protein BJX99DRAFT_264360 [Aspergillus californicus]